MHPPSPLLPPPPPPPLQPPPRHLHRTVQREAGMPHLFPPLLPAAPHIIWVGEHNIRSKGTKSLQHGYSFSKTNPKIRRRGQGGDRVPQQRRKGRGSASVRQQQFLRAHSPPPRPMYNPYTVQRLSPFFYAIRFTPAVRTFSPHVDVRQDLSPHPPRPARFQRAKHKNMKK